MGLVVADDNDGKDDDAGILFCVCTLVTKVLPLPLPLSSLSIVVLSSCIEDATEEKFEYDDDDDDDDDGCSVDASGGG